MVNLQEWIHRIEEGPYIGYLRTGLLWGALLSLWFCYNWRCFRNMNTMHAMDAAQVARNVSEGKGFSTQFIRPLSIHFVAERNKSKYGPMPSNADADYPRLKGLHPDLSNPPVYPLLLAGWMKVYKELFNTDPADPMWVKDGKRMRNPDDFFICILNQFIFFGVLAMSFLVAKKLFDQTTAWLTTALLLGCEMLWRFTISGLPTLLLALIFLGLVWLVVQMESESREPKHGPNRMLLLATGVGVLTGFGAMTKYSFGWIIVPVVVFIWLFIPLRRGTLCIAAVLAMLALLLPWMWRNYNLSGLPLGLATCSPLEATYIFPSYKLERSLNPDFSVMHIRPFVHKLLTGLRQLFLEDFVRLGGSWASPFFMVGLMLAFRNLALRRIRYFTLGVLAMLMIAQALGRTQASEDVLTVNGENLIILVFPLVLMFGISMFLTLLDQINFMDRVFRYLTIALFSVAMCLPLISAFLPPRGSTVAYPPYFPPAIKQTAGFMKESELMMSDIPWAVAWYGNRQCVWLTLDAQEQFFAINDNLKPVRGLYLTPLTMDSRFLTEWVRAGEHSWGSFVLEGMLRREIPPTFPLRKAPNGYLPEQLFLTDWERWKTTLEPGAISPRGGTSVPR